MTKLASLITEAAAHIAAADPRLATLIKETGPLDLTRRLEATPDDHFGALTACLIGQRKSERDTIRQHAVFRQRFGRPFATPQKMLSITTPDPANFDQGVRMNASTAIIQATMAGQGVAPARRALVAQDIEEGRLVHIFAEISLPINWAYFAVASPEALTKPPVIAFHSWMVERWQ